MRIKEVIQKIRENEEILKKEFKIKGIGVFGSLAREEKDVHDTDIVVEFREPVGWEMCMSEVVL